jgi:hypothetical protein
MTNPLHKYSLRSSVRFIYHQFNIQQFYIVFCVDLRTKRDYIPIQH